MSDSSSDDPMELSDSDDTEVPDLFMRVTHPNELCAYTLHSCKFTGISEVTIWDWCEKGKSVWVREVGHDDTMSTWEIPIEDLNSRV